MNGGFIIYNQKGKKLIDGNIKVGDKTMLYSEFMKSWLDGYKSKHLNITKTFIK